MTLSCLMVTRPTPERRAMRERAIADYLRQSHPDRELVIVVDQGDAAERVRVAAMIGALGRADIRLVLPDAPLTLGALRNLSIASARGDLLCQWDDDDLHHPDRIVGQMEALDASRQDAVILSEVMMLDDAARRLVWTNWARTPAGGHPATLLCHRRAAPLYPETGPSARQGEDLAAVLQLREAGALHLQAGAPHLYVYVAHGANTWEPAHQAMLMETLAISKALLERRAPMLREGLAPFDFGGPVAVEGANGPAFSL